jgi:hypothetical protein
MHLGFDTIRGCSDQRQTAQTTSLFIEQPLATSRVMFIELDMDRFMYDMVVTRTTRLIGGS